MKHLPRIYFSLWLLYVTVQLLWLFLWLKWAHGFDVRARAKTIIHLSQQTQDFNQLHLTLDFIFSRKISCDISGQTRLSAFSSISVFLLMRQLGSLARNMASRKLNDQKQLPVRRYNKTFHGTPGDGGEPKATLLESAGHLCLFYVSHQVQDMPSPVF